MDWNDIRVFEVFLNASIGFVNEQKFMFVENEKNRLIEIRIECHIGD